MLDHLLIRAKIPHDVTNNGHWKLFLFEPMPWNFLAKYLLLIASSIRYVSLFTSIADHNSLIFKESIRNLIFC